MKRMYAIDANRVFLLSAIVPQGLIYLVAVAGLRDRMMLQFLIQIFLAFPAVAYLCMQGIPLKEGIGVRRIGWKEAVLLVPLAVCVDQIATFINVLSQLFTVNTVGNHMAELMIQYPVPVGFLVIAVTPAICEELVYRGVLYRGYRRCGKWVAIVLTAVLFGLMHTNLNQLCYAVVLGLLFALVNEITGSVLPSVFLHLYINGRSVAVVYRWMKEKGVNSEDTERLQEYLASENIVVSEQLMSLLPVFLISVAGTLLIIYLLQRGKRQKEASEDLLRVNEKTQANEEKGSFKEVVSPALVIGVLYCVAGMFLM